MAERRADRSPIRVEAVRKQLEHLAREGEFEQILVQDESGLLLEQVHWAEDDHQKDLVAFHHVLSGFRSLLAEHMTLHLPEEVSVVSMDGHRLLCRFFEYGDTLLAVVVVTRGSRPARELVDRAVSGVRRILMALDA